MEKMDKIKKYVDRFIATAKVNEKYDMSATELLALANRANSGDALNAVSTTFSFGYAKGYRAAMAEMKKGGAEA